MSKLVFISGKYTGKDSVDTIYNIELAEYYGLSIAKMGGFPIIPHCNTRLPFTLIQPYDFFIDGYLRLLEKCDCVFMLPNWKGSHGANLEHNQAKLLRIPIHYELSSLLQWLKN